VVIYEGDMIGPERQKREEPLGCKAKLNSVIWIRGDRRLLYGELSLRGGKLNTEERVVGSEDARIVSMDCRFGGLVLLLLKIECVQCYFI
jgi:hypothetical protein